MVVCVCVCVCVLGGYLWACVCLEKENELSK